MSDEPSAILLHALEQLLLDRDAGRLQNLESYQARFPGLDAELAEHYAALTADDEAAPDDGARRVGRYRLVEELGRGGQGVVHRALDDALGRTVALKLLTGLGALDEGALRRFLREAQATSRLDHPGICPVYEHGQDDGLPFIAMGFVEGRPLAEQLAARAGQPPPASKADIDALLQLFEHAARALHAAHAAGVVHRDVKPGNLMIRPDGTPVLLDFGVARILEDDDGATLTRTGHVLGTPAYMSPEQVSGADVPVDHRTDVYGLGVSLFEALTHSRPFDAPTREGLYRQILADPPPDARRLNPRLPVDVRAIVETALAKHPDDRYATAEALADDLGRARRGEPIAAQPPTTLVRIGKWAARNPGWVASLAVISVLLAVGTLVTSSLAVQAENARGEAEGAQAAAEDALEEAERLADVARFEQLREEFDTTLWPPHPDNVRAHEDWLARMAELRARRPAHVETLEALRALALPQTDADRAADARYFEHELAYLEDLPRQRRGAADDPVELANIDEMERRIHERMDRRTHWTFADPAQQLRHDTLHELCRELWNVGVQPGGWPVTIDAVRDRLALARHMGERLAGEDAAVWRRCLDDVARPDSVYGGLALRPTAGLSPLGVDRDSGLWEFWHVASGARPRWEGEPGGPGRVQLHADSGAEGVVLVLLPGGTYSMGAEQPGALASAFGATGGPNVDPAAVVDEGPVHPVTLAPFLMSKYEVTRGQWARLHREDPYLSARSALVEDPGNLRQPVVDVDWDACLETCRRWGLQLPTEAQWEYACRAGATTPYATGAEDVSLFGHANVADSETFSRYGVVFDSPTLDGSILDLPVGRLTPNAFGLHDLHGNVAEWCRDGFMIYGVARHGPGDGMLSPLAEMSHRVRRPGSFGLPPVFARASARDKVAPGFSASDTGFRPAAPAPLAD